jgi:ATP-dependent 26S proteasome regulatory subunit
VQEKRAILIKADWISKFLSFSADYIGCTRVILVAEDIGGTEEEGSHRPREVDSGMLNLLDGNNVVFKLPTFIIATTNYPQNLLSALADRPGRFDQLIRLPTPNKQERVELVKFIAKRELTEEESTALQSDSAESLSIAHLKEIIVRSLLHDKTFMEVISDMKTHKEQFEGGFEKKNKRTGFNWMDRD